MTTITTGMTPTQFIAAINANLLALYGTGNYTTMTNVNQLTFDATLNTNLSRLDTYVGSRGSYYEGLLNSNFTGIYHGIFDTAFINTLSDFCVTFFGVAGHYFNGKTYLVFQSVSNDNPYIICYTHATNTWSTTVLIASNPLGPHDEHGEPTLLIDSTGYIHVMFGSHGTAIYYSKSTNPEDISS